VLYLVSIMSFCSTVGTTKNNKIQTILFLIFWYGSSMEFDFSLLISPCMFPMFFGCAPFFVPFQLFRYFFEKLKSKDLSALAMFSCFLGPENNRLRLDWPTRLKICIGIARGLVFLHEESRLKIVHRDIKATNVLLDGDLNPKISDFGLAKLDEEEKTHISTRVAGTMLVSIFYKTYSYLFVYLSVLHT
jgi:serine/threonine protein kinase